MYIQEGSNYFRRSFAEDVIDIKLAISRGAKATYLGEKDGLVMKHILCKFTQFIVLQKARKNGKIVGMVSLGTRRSALGYTVCASYLLPEYRGKGLGTCMYLGAVHQLGVIRSSTCLGEMSLRTYKTLQKFHKVEMYDMGTRQAVRFTWGDKIPRVGGRRIDSVSSYYHFVVRKSR